MFDLSDVSSLFGPAWDTLPADRVSLADLADRYLDPTWVTTLALPFVQDQLAHFLGSTEGLEALRIPFGDDFDRDRAAALLQDWLTGDWSTLPTIAIVPGEVLPGANAGFDALTGTIYLADRWLSATLTDPMALVDSLLEELGHFLDAQINPVDAPGDEGAIFAAIVQQKELTVADLTALKLEDDTATVVIGDRTFTIERSGTLDNTLATANDLGTLNAPQVINDFVGTTDTVDYYRFAIANPSTFSLLLDGMTANANVRLLNASGQQIAASTRTGITPDSISRILDAGTYFVQVLPVSGANTNYTLSLNAEALPPDGAGNTLGTALPLGTLNGTQSFYEAVGGMDTNDYYSFSVTSPINLSLVLGGMTANANLRLLNASGQQIVASNKLGSATETINRILNVGNYFVQVLPVSGARTAYTLDITATVLPPDLAGNTLSTARDLGSLTGTQNFFDFVGAIDPHDYYRFTLDTSHNFNLVLDGLSANANVRLLNASGQQIVASSKTGTAADTISRTLNAGTYFVHVLPVSGANTTYNLSLTADPIVTPPPAGGFKIQFDYRFDTQGFFNSTRRAVLEAAASIWESIIQDEFADVPAGTPLYVRDPRTSNTMVSITAGTIDDLMVFVASRNIDGVGNTLADAGPSAVYSSGSSLQTRWEGPDFEPWTGNMSFDTSENWFFDTTPDTANDIPAGAADFLTVAIHELGHILGFSNSSNAFTSRISGGNFIGPIASSLYGGPVPMQGTHIAASAGNHLMNTSYTFGTRKLPSNLDRAILDDIGYTVSYS